LDRAIGYLVKAFYTVGLEELLWYITTLEALLGARSEGVLERVSARVAAILGESANERKQIRKAFKDLYALRSNLVHGNRFEKRAEARHLWVAREMCRQVVLWFLRFLDHVQASRLEPDEEALSIERSDVLAMIDMDVARRAAIAELNRVLPEGFPHVKGWTDWECLPPPRR